MQRKPKSLLVRVGALATGLILAVATGSPSRSAELTDQALLSKINLLNGRLTIDMPSGTEVDSGHRSKKRDEASEVQDQETRASVTFGKDRLDLSVRELYATSGKDFDGNAKRFSSQN